MIDTTFWQDTGAFVNVTNTEAKLIVRAWA